MTGVLREESYEVVKEKAESEQCQLSSFVDTGPTTIAVVRLPRDTQIEQYCDEWLPELGMPQKHLKRFWQYRSGFRTNSAVDNPTERAYREARLDYHYGRYIRTSDEAQKALNAIVGRLSDGEDITLVCFEKTADACHRHYLKEIIESRRDSVYDFYSENSSLSGLSSTNPETESHAGQ
jgi:hypothetical protein